jgi:competence protein ComEC
VIWILIPIFFVRVTLYPNPLWRLNLLFAQDLCVQWSFQQQLSPIFAGLICGKSLPAAEQSLFLNLGIYHWLVASGGHLIFIQQILDWSRIKSSRFRFILLLVYTLICGFQAPILRAYMSLLLMYFSNQKGLFLTRQQRNLNAGLLCLCLFPEWLQSFSFQLSWIASLALDPKKSLAFQAFSISIFLWPLSLSWSPLHLIYNIVLTPLFSFFLFPMTIFFFLLAPIFPFGNIFWQVICKALQLLPSESNGLVSPDSSTDVWVYIWTVQIILLVLEKYKK